jgi:hypothetical protein
MLKKKRSPDELLPFDAVIQSEMGGKRMKFYGNTRFNFNQAYFSNWISGGESAFDSFVRDWITTLTIRIEMALYGIPIYYSL